MGCHVTVCALFKVVTPFQSATVTQLLASWPCTFHVLLAQEPYHQSSSTVWKSICWQKTQNLPRSLDVFKACYLPWGRPLLQPAGPGSGRKPTPALQLTRGPSVWSVRAECASTSHPTTAVCILWQCWLGFQHPSVTWGKKKKKEMHMVGEQTCPRGPGWASNHPNCDGLLRDADPKFKESFFVLESEKWNWRSL